MIDEPDVKCNRCGSVGDTYRLCAGCGAPTTSSEPDAVRVDKRLVEYMRSLPIGHLTIGGELTPVVQPQYLLASDRDAILAALSRPAHGGWEDKPVYDACAKALSDKFKDTADGHFREDVIAACVRTIQHAERWRDSGRAVQAALARNDRGTGEPRS